MLGHVLDHIDLNRISDEAFLKLRKAIPKHGVICVKNQVLSADELISFTKRFGQPVLLPKALRFNNTQKEYPELARVSNIMPDGALIKNHKAAEYWHSDGDFWQPEQNYIFNLLYAVTVPEKGGETGFSDLRMAYQSLDEDLKRKIENLQVVVSCDEIPDFKDVPAQDRYPDAYHFIKHQHIETKMTGLYIGHTFAKIEGLSQEASNSVVEELVKAIEMPENQYIHQWDVGDILIWDNTSVMHRSMGGYFDSPRLLYRTQAFVSPF